ncbi:MAG: ATP-binding protein [bacterium]
MPQPLRRQMISSFRLPTTSFPPLHHAVVAQRGGGTPQALSSFRRHTSYFPSRTPLLAAACFKAGYIDAWGRGIEKMTHACESAGLPTPTFESNSGGVLATFTLHPASVGPVEKSKRSTTPEVAPEVEAQSRAQAESGAESRAESREESSLERLLNYLAEKPHSKSEIAFHLGQKGVTGALNRTVKQLFEEGLIEMTIPDKPNSRLQKYRLTEKGRKIK